MEKIVNFTDYNTGSILEAKFIDATPDWKNLYKYFKHIEKTDPKTFKKMIGKMGKSEWDKLEKLGKEEEPKKESVESPIKECTGSSKKAKKKMKKLNNLLKFEEGK